jgi:uncharacterized membrane protein
MNAAEPVSFQAAAPHAAPPHAVWTRAFAVSSIVGLIALGLAWELWLAPTGRGTLALKVLPLAFAVTGLLKYRMQTYRWTSLLVWPYVAEGIVRASTEPGRSALLAALEVALCLLLFVACVAHVRWRLRAAKGQAA